MNKVINLILEKGTLNQMLHETDIKIKNLKENMTINSESIFRVTFALENFNDWYKFWTISQIKPDYNIDTYFDFISRYEMLLMPDNIFVKIKNDGDSSIKKYNNEQQNNDCIFIEETIHKGDDHVTNEICEITNILGDERDKITKISDLYGIKRNGYIFNKAFDIFSVSKKLKDINGITLLAEVTDLLEDCYLTISLDIKSNQSDLLSHFIESIPLEYMNFKVIPNIKPSTFEFINQNFPDIYETIKQIHVYDNDDDDANSGYMVNIPFKTFHSDKKLKSYKNMLDY